MHANPLWTLVNYYSLTTCIIIAVTNGHVFFFLSTVMAILPVYTTSKLHAARINLKHLGVSFNYVKGVVFGRKWAWFSKIFAGGASAPDLTNPPS